MWVFSTHLLINSNKRSLKAHGDASEKLWLKKKNGKVKQGPSLEWIGWGVSWAGHQAAWRWNARVTDSGRRADICCTGGEPPAFVMPLAKSSLVLGLIVGISTHHLALCFRCVAMRAPVTWPYWKDEDSFTWRDGGWGFPSSPCRSDLALE